MKKLIVEEEYGFKYWFWRSEGTEEEIQKNFKEVTSVSTYYAERDKLPGEWVEVEWEEWREVQLDGEYDGFAHIHNYDDSTIRWRQK